MSYIRDRIFAVVKQRYPDGEPHPNGRFDPIYALFKRYAPRPAQRQMAFFTDTSLCSGCKACEVACKQWNQIESEPLRWSGDSYDNTFELSDKNWRHVKFIERFPAKNTANRPAPTCLKALLNEPKVGEWHFMSDQCKHCRTSPCHEACPTGAIMRNEFGAVYYQTDICMGCRMCMAACPFGVPQLNPQGHSQKCAECYDRLRDGLTPACQTACTTGAIQFGARDIMLEAAQKRLAFLHAQGRREARLYGADGFNNYDGLNSFYLLMDKPEVYGLPAEPVTPVLHMAGDYLRGIATLLICAAAVAACL